MEAHNILKFRAVTTQMSTCGYYDGDPSKVRTADPGYNCRVDISRGLWGFCPTTVISANDCGMAGACVDEGTCSSVCGFSGAAATTFSCTESDAPYCSTALLDAGVDQTFSYIACGQWPTTETLLAAPTATSMTITSTGAASTASTDATSTSTTESTPSRTITPTPQPNTANSPLQQQPTASVPVEPESSSGPPTNLGGIIGGVLGGLALICATVLGVVYLRRSLQRRESNNDESSHPPSNVTEPPKEQLPQYVPPQAPLLGQSRHQIAPVEIYSSPVTQQSGEVAELQGRW
ncbi:hypothetical protein MGN70_004256 [Eutypa lata]|nr:hypothetical protein MGN70_004256 [Eutypa lata]